MDPVQAPGVYAGVANVIAAVMLLLEFGLLRQALVRDQVRLYVAQSALISVLAVVIAADRNLPDPYALAGLSAALKVAGVPLVLRRLLRGAAGDEEVPGVAGSHTLTPASGVLAGDRAGRAFTALFGWQALTAAFYLLAASDRLNLGPVVPCAAGAAPPAARGSRDPVTMGALKSPWVLQQVFAGFSILSPSWLWLAVPAMLLVVVAVAWAASGRRMLRVRRVPAWRSATIGVDGADSCTAFGYANPTRRVLAGVLHTRTELRQVMLEEDAGDDGAGPPDGPGGETPEQAAHLEYASDVIEVVETYLYRPGLRLRGDRGGGEAAPVRPPGCIPAVHADRVGGRHRGGHRDSLTARARPSRGTRWDGRARGTCPVTG